MYNLPFWSLYLRSIFNLIDWFLKNQFDPKFSYKVQSVPIR